MEYDKDYIKKNISGVGRIFIQTLFKDASYFFPKFHFLLFKDDTSDNSECFSALCIELNFLHFDKSTEQAISGLEALCRQQIEILLDENMQKNLNVESMVSELSNNGNEQYWEIYREVNFRNALKQKKTADQPELVFEVIQQSRVFYKGLLDFNQKLISEDKTSKDVSKTKIKDMLDQLNCPRASSVSEFFPVAV